METAKAAEDRAWAEGRERKVQKAIKGARQSYEQSVVEGPSVFEVWRTFKGASGYSCKAGGNPLEHEQRWGQHGDAQTTGQTTQV